MPKRRRRSSEEVSPQSPSSSSASSITVTRSSKRQKKVDPMETCMKLYDAVRFHKGSGGRLLCEPLIRVPKRRTSPDYYNVVQVPIDLLKIHQKLKNEEYTGLNHFAVDMDLLFSNAKKYYKADTREFQDTAELEKLFKLSKEAVESGTCEDPFSVFRTDEDDDEEEDDDEGSVGDGGSKDRQPATRSTRTHPLRDEAKTRAMLEDLFTVLSTATDSNGREISGPFLLVPERSKYPTYYDVVPKPMDLKIIASKIIGKAKPRYTSLDEMQRDVFQIVKNASTFNDYRSLICRDARLMNKQFIARKELLESGKMPPSDGPSYSKQIAELAYEEDTPEVSHFFVDIPEEPVRTETPAELNRSRTPQQSVEPSRILEVRASSPLVPTKKTGVKVETEEADCTSTTQGDHVEVESEDEELFTGPFDRSSFTTEQERFWEILEVLRIAVDPNDGRPLCTPFLKRPSRRANPEYYSVVSEPMDFAILEANICENRYTCIDDFARDVRLLFINARRSEVDNSSTVLQDAATLEKVFNEQVRSSDPMQPQTQKVRHSSASRVKRATPTAKKLIPEVERARSLFHSIRQHKDERGRELAASIFRLPTQQAADGSWTGNVLDLEKIEAKMARGDYQTLDSLFTDVREALDNAIRIGGATVEPEGSQMVRDATVLLQVGLQRKFQLTLNLEGSIPDVRGGVQQIFEQLVREILTFSDEDDRLLSDSLHELPLKEQDGSTAPTLDHVWSLLQTKEHYKRLEFLQEDVFTVLKRARVLSRTDSQVFEDSYRLQKLFIEKREELSGHTLLSPAHRYTLEELNEEVSALRSRKQPHEGAKQPPSPKMEGLVGAFDTIEMGSGTYRAGDFVYLSPDGHHRSGAEPSIMLVENFYRDSDGRDRVYGLYFLRPAEAVRMGTPRSMVREVLRSDIHASALASRIIGRCYVMFLPEYFSSKPDGIPENDVFVCEFKYRRKERVARKIGPSDFRHLPYRRRIPLSKRDHRLPRTMSTTHVPPVDVLDWSNNPLLRKDRTPENVLLFPQPETILNNEHYYEQYVIPTGVIRLGDCVYVRVEDGKKLIAQVDQIWVTTEGVAYFHGPWYVTPDEIYSPMITKFYPHEVFLSSIQDTNPLLAIVQKCCVLSPKDAANRRPTEYDEEDIFICESMYDEARREFMDLGSHGLKQYTHSDQIQADEVYLFEGQWPIEKIEFSAISFSPPPNLGQGAAPAMVPETNKAEDVNGLPAQTAFTSDPSAGISLAEPSTPEVPAATPSATPLPTTPQNRPHPSSSSKKKKGSSSGSGQSGGLATTTAVDKDGIPLKKKVTGYILYSREIRQTIQSRYPNESFGQISKLVGNEWRRLPASVKKEYEDRACRLFSGEITQIEVPPEESPALRYTGPIEQFIWDCGWEGCDWSFGDQVDLVEHCTEGEESHAKASNTPEMVERNEGIRCFWRQCARMKKNLPFPNMKLLIKHLKEIHIHKLTPRRPGDPKVLPVADDDEGKGKKETTGAGGGQQSGIVATEVVKEGKFKPATSAPLVGKEALPLTAAVPTPGSSPKPQTQPSSVMSPTPVIVEKPVTIPPSQPVSMPSSAEGSPYHVQPQTIITPAVVTGMIVDRPLSSSTPPVPLAPSPAPAAPAPAPPAASAPAPAMNGLTAAQTTTAQVAKPIIKKKITSEEKRRQLQKNREALAAKLKETYLTPIAPSATTSEAYFLSPPRANRLCHSEPYLRYIEFLGKGDNGPTSASSWNSTTSTTGQQHTVVANHHLADQSISYICDVERILTSTLDTCPPPDPKHIPGHWLGVEKAESDSEQQTVLEDLWMLRDYMVADSLKLSRHVKTTTPFSSSPLTSSNASSPTTGMHESSS